MLTCLNLIKNKKGLVALALLSLLPLPILAQASAKAFPMPQATRLVVFNYNPNQTYTILTRPNAVTDIVLSPGEKVEALALGNTIQWITAKSPGNIFIKPNVPNVYTSGTLVTNKRIYELSFRSSPENGTWYQRVSWHTPKILLFKNNQAMTGYNNSGNNTDLPAIPNSVSSHNISSESVPVNAISNIHFGYHISGDAPFKPVEVFNNKIFTWIKLPNNNSVIPVFFIKRNGKYNITNYTVNGNYLVVHQVFKKGILEADGYKIRIRYR
jgi:type IV secretion system protein VirB9